MKVRGMKSVDMWHKTTLICDASRSRIVPRMNNDWKMRL